jgi:hypothetical protein
VRTLLLGLELRNIVKNIIAVSREAFQLSLLIVVRGN